MAGEWEVWLDDPTGRRLILLDEMLGGTAAKVANTPGSCSILLPPDYDPYIRLDGIIEIWRRAAGGALSLFNAYFVRGWTFADQGGLDVTIINGVDGLSILEARINAYAAGSANSAASAEAADDLLKRIITINCSTGATDADRDLTSLGVTVAADVTAAPTVSIGFSYRALDDLFQDVADASRTAGTNLYYDFVPVPASDGSLGWDFRTYTGQPGTDRTGTDQILIGREFGNLAGAAVEYDYRDEKTYVYVGGRGLEDDRALEEVEDTTRLGASPWNRREKFYNAAGQHSSSAEYYAAGQGVLAENRPRMKIAGEIIDTQQARFGVDWNFGDRVVLAYRGYQWDAVITGIVLEHRGGMETIRATFEVQP